MENISAKYTVDLNRELIEDINMLLMECNNNKIKELFLNTMKNIEIEYTVADSRKILTVLLNSLLVIKDNLIQNKPIRNDYFELKSYEERSDIDEFIEGIIIAAKNEHEYRKLKYYGYLLGNIIFKDNFDKDECERLIRLSRILSYSQIKLINMYMISQTIQVPILKREDYTKCGIKDYKLLGILQDTLEMIQRGILNGSGKLVLDMVQINPSKTKVQGIGTLIYNLMSINKMPYDELEDILDILSN